MNEDLYPTARTLTVPRSKKVTHANGEIEIIKGDAYGGDHKVAERTHMVTVLNGLMADGTYWTLTSVYATVDKADALNHAMYEMREELRSAVTVSSHGSPVWLEETDLVD